MKHPDTKLLLFAKAPIPGYVKTRIIPRLGIKGASRLHCFMFSRIVKLLLDSNLSSVDVWCTPTINHTFFNQFKNINHLKFRLQKGVGLGQRMMHAFNEGFKTHSYVVALGIDCPQINTDIVNSAINKLKCGNNAVVVPAEDGGYVLLGLRKMHSTLFENIKWGSPSVYKSTRYKLNQLGWRWCSLDTCWDVDRPEDVDRLVLDGYCSEQDIIDMNT